MQIIFNGIFRKIACCQTENNNFVLFQLLNTIQAKKWAKKFHFQIKYLFLL